MSRRVGEQLAGNKVLRLPVAAGAKIYEGDIVALNAQGYAAKAGKAENLVTAGAAKEYIDNTLGEDGAEHILLQRGVFILANSGDIEETDLLKTCYFAGPDSVTLTSAGSSAAGKIYSVEGGTVAVEMI